MSVAQQFLTFLRLERGLIHFRLFAKYNIFNDFSFQQTMNHMAEHHPQEEHVRNLEVLWKAFQEGERDFSAVELPYPPHYFVTRTDPEEVLKMILAQQNESPSPGMQPSPSMQQSVQASVAAVAGITDVVSPPVLHPSYQPSS